MSLVFWGMFNAEEEYDLKYEGYTISATRIIISISADVQHCERIIMSTEGVSSELRQVFPGTPEESQQ